MPEFGKDNKNIGVTLLVWDSDGTPPNGDWITVLWSDYPKTNEQCVISIPVLVEEKADMLKARYLAWIYELGETKIKGKRLIDHLELRPGFSFWWMTSIAHKPNFYESQHINTVLKCFAFEVFCIRKYRPTNIRLITDSKATKAIFQEFCLNENLEFSCRLNISTLLRKNKKLSINLFLASCLKATIFLFFRIIRTLWYFNRSEKTPGNKVKSVICCFDIFVHLQSQSFSKGKFLSNYWSKLIDLLERLNLQTTWIHTYYQHQDIRSIESARNLVQRFNSSDDTQNFHVLLDSQLDILSALNVMFDYCRLTFKYLQLSEVKNNFRPLKSNFNFWLLFKNNWHNSLVGPQAMSNCISIRVYNRLLRRIPRQSIGFYIQENQPWEMALIYAWRTAGHGRIIGVPHTTVRFWDLRYFYDPRTYIRQYRNDLPMPDMVAVNGLSALKAYLNGGYHKSQIFQVEALRYFHLIDGCSLQKKEVLGGSALRILIFGDNISMSNEKLMQIVAEADSGMPRGTRYIFKRHKASSFDVTKYTLLNLTVSDETPSKLLNTSDIVIVGNVTSAALDAYYKGLIVATLLDGKSPNASPLRGMSSVNYFTNAADLLEIIRYSGVSGQLAPDSYFHLDEMLPRWIDLLDLNLKLDDPLA